MPLIFNNEFKNNFYDDKNVFNNNTKNFCVILRVGEVSNGWKEMGGEDRKKKENERKWENLFRNENDNEITVSRYYTRENLISISSIRRF